MMFGFTDINSYLNNERTSLVFVKKFYPEFYQIIVKSVKKQF